MDNNAVPFTKKGIDLEVNKEEFALTLKTWRLRQGYTQEEVGRRWGTSRYTIIRAEKAKDITWESAYKLFAKLSYELQNEKI